jgi:hypothetical protein
VEVDTPAFLATSVTVTIVDYWFGAIRALDVRRPAANVNGYPLGSQAALCSRLSTEHGSIP